ncbi:MAG: glycosyltransferase family protein [Spirulina sp.]
MTDYGVAPATIYKSTTSPPTLRIALYSHDTMGLGHKRRNLLIAQALRQALPHCSVLLISGMAEASDADLPDGIDYLTLPAWQKTADGEYQPRRLGLSVEDLQLLRAKTIRAALKAFNPDVFIVDNVPRGAMQELDLALELLRRRPTRCILGLRDILDDPQTVRRQWRQAKNIPAIRRYFDDIWVYGDPAVYDLAAAYRFPADIAAKIRYVGYLDAQVRLDSLSSALQIATPKPPFALAMVGGGQDGVDVAKAFAQAAFPPGWQGILITGPLMPQAHRQTLHQIASQRSDLTVLESHPEPTQLLAQASAVVAMGGYNTTCEILALGTSALIVPRTQPRREQWIRAQRLHQLGLVDVLEPEQLNAPAITTWLHTVANDRPSQRPTARDCLDLNGLKRIPQYINQLMAHSGQDRSSHYPLKAV